jgi:hypothetical protein
MQPSLNRKLDDHPHDMVAVAPDAVRVAPSDAELSSLLQQAARQQRAEPAMSSVPHVAAAPEIPPPDMTIRPSVNDTAASLDSLSPADFRAVPASKGRRSIASRAGRGFLGLLLAVGIGVSGAAWKSYGDVAQRQIAKVAAKFMLAPATAENSDSATPAVEADATAPATTQAAAPASGDQSQLLQSMARDLASLGQQVEQLKAGMEDLKANQAARDARADMSRPDAAKPADAAPKAKVAVLPPRPAVVKPHKPVTAAYYPPPPVAPAAQAAPVAQASAAPLPPPSATYAPRQFDAAPSTAQQPVTLSDPELASVPRPPMPVR